MPHTGASQIVRGVVCAFPGGTAKLIHGNYGGPGNEGGPPKDSMDELFRRHDLDYTVERRISALWESDRRLVAGLRELGELPVEVCEEYRVRAIGYFTRPMSRVVGKPFGVWFGWAPRADEPSVRWHEEYTRRNPDVDVPHVHSPDE